MTNKFEFFEKSSIQKAIVVSTFKIWRTHTVLSALLIIFMQLLFVPLTTLRTTFMVKGDRRVASLVALAEEATYVIALGMIFSDLKNILNMAAYAIGYGLGVYFGCIVEAKLAVGFRSFSVHFLKRDDELIEKIRQEGFGVTIFEGEEVQTVMLYAN